jgi:protein-S-isoprenylcysteine O-methyltransferase Ste14
MDTYASKNLTPPKEDSGIGWKMVVRFILVSALMPLILFAAAGSFDWWQAWIFTIVTILGSFGSRYLLFRKNPALFAERGRFTEAENVQSWDRLIAPIIAIVGPLAVLIVAGLDKRNGWSSDMALIWPLVGTLMLVLGMGVSTWAMLANPFFSSVVRIQQDRGQTVITSGPYRIVRHPAYSSGILVWLGTPVMLGALWALIPAVGMIILCVLRTALEDRTLQAELPGYKDYTQQTRYRLLPGVW